MFSGKKSKRLRKYERQLNRSHVKFERYVKDFYLENDLAYISCNVKGYNDIIDPMSVEGYEWLDEHFTYFVESNAEYIPVDYPIVLQICGAHFTQKEKDVIEETIHDYYALKMGDAQLDIEANRRKALWLLVIGVALALIVELYTMAVGKTNMLYELIFLFFYLFVWDSGDTFFLDGFDLRENKRYAAQMAMIKVVFCEVFDDTPDDEAVTEEIFSEILDSSDAESEQETDETDGKERSEE